MAAKGKICVSIFENDPDKALEAATKAEQAADVVEIRLDAMENPTPSYFLSRLKGEVLVTCRPEWEGGAFKGSEEDRLAILLDGVNSGAAFVDIELKAEKTIRQGVISGAKDKGVRSIVSWHDFNTTASAGALATIFQEQSRTGADIGKIVTTARDFLDVLRVLGLQELARDTGFPLCAFCMGRAGMISRVATLEMGGYMSYAAADDGPAAAPGQLPISTMRMIMEAFASDQG